MSDKLTNCSYPTSPTLRKYSSRPTPSSNRTSWFLDSSLCGLSLLLALRVIYSVYHSSGPYQMLPTCSCWKIFFNPPPRWCSASQQGLYHASHLFTFPCVAPTVPFAWNNLDCFLFHLLANSHSALKARLKVSEQLLSLTSLCPWHPHSTSTALTALFWNVFTFHVCLLSLPWQG